MPTPQGDQSFAAQVGFTLVELLVGLALFGLLAATGLVALQGAARVWRGAEARAAGAAAVETAQALLRRQLEGAVPYADGATVAFAGTADSLTWVARRPAAAMPGGFYVLNLTLDGSAVGARDGSGGGRRLTLGWRTFDPRLPLDDQPPDDRVVLLDGVARLVADYHGSADGWQAEWRARPGLPRLIRLDVTMATGRPWPSLLVAPGLPLLLDAGG